MSTSSSSLVLVLQLLSCAQIQQVIDEKQPLAGNFLGCNIRRQKVPSLVFPEQPTLFDSATQPNFTMNVNQIDSHADPLWKTVRWPIGINQFGSCERRVKSVSYFLEHEMLKPHGGLLFDKINQASAQAAFGINHSRASPFWGLSTDIILSMGGPEQGLPFHNHAAAWQTVVSGKKLFLFLPPLPPKGSAANGDWTARSIPFSCPYKSNHDTRLQNASKLFPVSCHCPVNKRYWRNCSYLCRRI